jgi:hypothetical protein
MIDVCSLSQLQQYSIILVVSLIELWLGKTNRVKSNSILELSYNFSKNLFKFLFKKILFYIVYLIFLISELIRSFKKKG